MREFEPVFKVGDYISPIRKSIFCEFDGIGRIVNINEHTYSVKTKEGLIYVHIQFQELYRIVIPDKHQQF